MADAKAEINVRFTNADKRMGKNIEIGMIFPKEFLIEKKDAYSIVNDPRGSIIRYNIREIHSNTNMPFIPLTLTPLKRDNFKIQSFIKGENIESIYREFDLQVI